jgi:hypothetical protein
LPECVAPHLGYTRGCEKELEFLASFGTVQMTAIAIPRKGTKKDLPVRRLQDYHTVGGGYDPNSAAERGSITVSAEDGKLRAKTANPLRF